MSVYYSGFSASVESFVNSRKISGAWNETVFGMNIRLFDRYCAEHYPGEALRQEMVDIWCARRKTENVNSCYTRTLVIRLFIGYLRKRGQTDVLAPPALKQNKERRIPHAFSHEELERFFRECDQIIPCRGRLSHASEITAAGSTTSSAGGLDCPLQGHVAFPPKGGLTNPVHYVTGGRLKAV